MGNLEAKTHCVHIWNKETHNAKSEKEKKLKDTARQEMGGVFLSLMQQDVGVVAYFRREFLKRYIDLLGMFSNDESTYQ